MADKKVIYGMSRYARRYVHTGANGMSTPYGVMISGFRKGDDGKNHYVNLWLSSKDGTEGVYITKGHDGNPWLHVRLAEVTQVEGDSEKTRAEGAEQPKAAKEGQFDVFPDNGKTPF